MSEKTIRILCVDDEENVLKSLKRIFLDEDYEIITAVSGEEGLRIMQEQDSIQLVISDYRMPGMDGVEFLRKIYDNWPDTIRIVLSGYADTASVVDAINEGHIYKFIPKPWNDDELKVNVLNAVERYTLRMKNQQLTEKLQEANDELQIINQNLETLVENRTAEVMFQLQALQISQNILDALPMAVIGMDMDGLIVQSNRCVEKVLGVPTGGLLGNNRQDVFPDEIKAVIDKIMDKGFAQERITLNNKEVFVKGGVIRHTHDQNGIVLVLDDEACHE
ncbi:MAG TPA: response regulator [Deltaproteobacteria bacterium]|nr:response regulator [Deltaproteobacteria bacterium]